MPNFCAQPVRARASHGAFMNRQELRQRFGTRGPVVLPVIHVLETARTLENINILAGEGAQGCFLINHDFEVARFLPILQEVRAAQPDLWIGVNFLAVTGREAFPELAKLAQNHCRIDAYWADDARIDERTTTQTEAREIEAARQGWDGLYFGGTAFKKQRPVAPAHYGTAAKIACDWMDVVTTSGQATGIEADTGKIASFRKAIGERALAYDIEPARLRRLMRITQGMDI